MKASEELREFIDGLEIVDTHEHLPNEADRPRDKDVLAEYLTHYFSRDLVSAGLTETALKEACDSKQDLMKRWGLVENHWEAARNTGYGRSLDLAAEGIYGIKGIHRETIGALNEAFTAAREKGGHYQRVLKEKSKILLSVLDGNFKCDRRYFATVAHMRDWVMVLGHQDRTRVGERMGMAMHTLEDWEAGLEKDLEYALAQGTVAIKVALAYERSLHFPKVARADAEREFAQLVWPGPQVNTVNLQNYMFHQLLRLADQKGLTVQMHTGQQESSGNDVRNANVTHLINLFLEYANIKWAIMHLSYPYVMELGSVAKTFRNVFIDMAWGHIISPEGARRALAEWLDAVPANKICAFGGDYCFVDGVYGHQQIARQNVAQALAEKIAEGSMDLDRAKEVARWMLRDNPIRIFGLEGRIGKE